MGQRLNIEITKNGKLLANTYYHWSGFSNCAVNIVCDMIQNFNYIKKYKVQNVKNKDLLFSIRLLEQTGAGIEDLNEAIKEIGLIDENIDISRCKGRNEGVIEISELGMEENRNWEEGRVTIDIEKETIDYNVLHEIYEDDIQDYKDDGYKIEEINIDFKNIKFENIFELKAFIDKANYQSEYYFKNKFDNKYIGLIQ